MSETKVNLGFLPVNRGTYSNSATYYKDNIVQYNGSSYICTQDPGSGATPQGITGEVPYVSQPDVPNTHWAVFANNQGGPVEGIYDISANHATDNTPKAYDSLSAALADVPPAKKTGGLVVKFIQTTPATYNVVKTEGVTEQPTGTELDNASSIASGTYTASQLSDFSTLPTTSAVTYYVAVTEDETTTYTTWAITLASAESQEYVQYRLMKTAWSNVVGDWQGVDDEPVAGSRNLVESCGAHNAINILDAHINKLADRLYGQESSVIDLTNVEAHIGYIYNNKWRTSGNHSYKIVEVEAGKKIRATGNGSYNSNIIFLKSYPDSIVNDVTPVDFCDGTYYYAIDKGSFVDIIIPDDCVYMYVRVKASGNYIEVASVEYLEEEGDIPAIENDIAGIKRDITSIGTQVGTLETNVETQIGFLETAVDTLEETVDAIANDTHDVIDLETIERHNGYIYEGKWRIGADTYQHIVIPVVAGSKATCLGSDTTWALVWVLTEYNPVQGASVTFTEDYPQQTSIPKSTEVVLGFETNCYLVIQTKRSNTDVTPQSVVITKDSVITEKIESNEYIAAINQATIDNKAEIDELKEGVNEVDENFPVNPQILDTDTATVKAWDSKGDDAELIDGVSGEDFNVTEGDTKLTLTESCNINLEEWDAYEFVFRLSRPLSSSENVFIKLRNGSTELLNSNLGSVLRDSPYLNQLFRLRRAIKDITNYETISHTVDNVQLVFICSDPTFTLTMYGIRFIKTKPNVFISFDGGWTGVLDLALPVMTKYGIKGTAYVEIQYMTGEKTRADHMTAEQVRILDNNGWDVSNHSWHHRNWGTDSECTDEECEEDMKFSRNWLQQNGFVRGANFYAAPHGVTNVSRTTIFDKYMKYYRAGGGADYDGFVFPCGSRLTANGRSNVIQYITFGGNAVTAAYALSKINSGIDKGKSICINFHNIVADKAEGETYDAEEFPIGEFTLLIQTLATMRDAGTCYVLPNSVVWYGCHGAEVYDNVNAHAEMLGFNGKIISLDANKNLETV